MCSSEPASFGRESQGLRQTFWRTNHPQSHWILLPFGAAGRQRRELEVSLQSISVPGVRTKRLEKLLSVIMCHAYGTNHQKIKHFLLFGFHQMCLFSLYLLFPTNTRTHDSGHISLSIFGPS